MVNLLPTCVKCGSHVADSLEPEVEKSDQVKVGHYVNSVWMCDDCFRQTEGLEWQAPLMCRQILHELMKQMSLSIFVTSLQYRWFLNNVCLILLKTRQITAN
jgi:hypothetical protein